MGGNRQAKEELIRIFGPECFIEKLHLRPKANLEEDRKKYIARGQLNLMDQLTYHHILERCRGGKATVENGELLKYINHQWLHRLPEAQRQYINGLFQEYKQQFYNKLSVQFVDDLDTGIVLNFAELEATDKGVKINKHDNSKKKFAEQKEKRKEKRNLQRLRKEYEDR